MVVLGVNVICSQNGLNIKKGSTPGFRDLCRGFTVAQTDPHTNTSTPEMPWEREVEPPFKT